MKKIFNKIIAIIPYIMLLVSFLLVINVSLSIKRGNIPTIFGKAVFIVETPSMEDTIMTGDIIFVNTNTDEYHVGDIITFYKPPDRNITITHRIIKIDSVDGVKYYTTQGDNNYISNDWELHFSEDYIIGKYITKSTFIGFIYQKLFGNGVNLIFLAIVLIFVVVGLLELFNLISSLRQIKEREYLEEKERLLQRELEKLRKQERENGK